MSEKYYVGADLVASSNNGEYKPVSRVTLKLDDNNVITSGDDTGFELVSSCPHATQEMADALLRRFRGYVYHAFEADEANLNPSAELGDGVTAGGVYGVISKLSDDGSGFVGISAPGKAELEDEYPMDGPMSQMINRQLANVRTAITKTAEQIRLEVFGEDGYTGSSITAQLSAISAEVNGKIDGEDASALIRTALDGIELSISNNEGTTTFELTGGGATLTSEQFDLHVKAVNIHGKLTADQIETKDLTVDAANITGSLTIGQLPKDVATTGDIPTNLSDLNMDYLFERGIVSIIDGTVTADYVEALGITASSISASNITAGTLAADDISVDGLFLVKSGRTTYGAMGANTSKGGVAISDSTASVYFIATNNAAKMSYYETSMIWVAEGGCYSNQTMEVFSDKTLKHSISYNLDTEAKLFPKLRPCSFVYNNDPSNKKHWGFIAQDLVESVEDVGESVDDLAVLGRYDGKYTIGYGEITALNTLMIQKLMERVDALENA